MAGTWVKEAPEKPGLYWFYGDIYWGGMNRPPKDFRPEIEIVEVFKIQNGIAASCNGEFVSLKRGHGFYWSEPLSIPAFDGDMALPERNG